jgi:glycosyltransferase involved in cell wall biosynthesis
MYSSKDLAVIIPTKDRPKQVKRHLQSLVAQNCELGRVIVVASGKDVKNLMLDFQDSLPLEYYRSEPGQIRQRNMGISKLDERTKLVATMDDDVIYHEDAVAEMIHFWNGVEPNTVGVTFNIINLPALKHNWFRGLIGLSTPEPGQVLKSGLNTSIFNVMKNIQVYWLPGGTTVWRQDILLNNPHEELNIKWAVSEDLLFSYPLGRKYSLYVCSGAKVEVEDIIMDKQSKEFYIERGKSIYIIGLYFIHQNKNLSLIHFIINKFLYCIAQILKGAIYLDKSRIFIMLGIITAFLKSLRVLSKFQTVDEFKSEFIDTLE